MFSKSDVKDIYSLSPMQEGMLFHYMMNKNSAAYFEQLSYSIHGALDHKRIEQAFNRVIQRHEILRTVFVYKLSAKPRQVVLKKKDATIYFQDISHLSEEEKILFIADFKKRDRESGFDLSSDTLIRFSILNVSPNLYEVIWSFHHIIMDGWCTPIIIKEMLSIYSGLKKGVDIFLPPVTPYSSYIQWLDKQDKKSGFEFWQKYLEDYQEQAGINIPQENRAGDFILEQYRFTFDKTLTHRLEQLATTSKITLNITFQALWGLLLQKYNNKNDVVFGAVVAGRPAEIPGIETMLGLFINTIPIRVVSKPHELLPTFLQRMYGDMSNAKNHEYLPLAEIQAGTPLKGDLLNHILVFENYPLDKELEAINETKEFDLFVKNVEEYAQTNYDITVVITPGDQLSVKIKYNAAVYELHWIQRVVSHLEYIARQVTANANIPLADIDMLPDTEKQQLLVEFNCTGSEYPRDKTICQLFEEQVSRTPDLTALVFGERVLKYQELDERAEQLASVLMARGIAPDIIVGILVDPSIEMVCGILAVLKTGGLFLPIEPTFPPDRIRYMLADSQTQLVLTQSHLMAVIPGETQTINMDDLTLYQSHSTPVDHMYTPSHAVYVIYTSGTTGKSKGVLVQNQNLVNYVSWFKRVAVLTTQDRTLLTSSFGFDLGYTSLFPLILNGGQLHLIPRELYQSIQELLAYVEKQKITYLKMTPSLFSVIVEFPDFLLEPCRSVRLILLGGEKIKLKDVAQAHQVYPHIRFMNHYGPTETTIGAIAQFIDFDRFDYYQKRPTIGKPIDNTGVYILNREAKMVPIGIPGELCIFGDGVARGYLNRPELTAEKFTCQTTPAHSLALYYRTGDLVRWLDNGNIEFLGRIDQQVKIRGYRIELGEIASQLATHPLLEDAVVIAREDVRGDNHLCAYIVALGGIQQAPELSQLKEFLGKKLPEYMIPACFVPMEKIPLTPNGKVNQAMLPVPTGGPGGEKGQYIAPRTEREKLLAEIWSEILDKEKIGLEDNFFDLGGHSLKAMSIVSRVNKEFGTHLPLSTIFENPTIVQWGNLLAIKKDDSIFTVEPCPASAYYHLSHAQKRLWFFSQMAPGNPAYNESRIIRFTGDLDSQLFERSIKVLIDRHEALRTTITVVEESGDDGGDEFPVQMIHDQVRFAMQQADISNFPALERAGLFRRLLEEEGQKPFNLTQAPLLRVTLIRLAPDEHVMVIILHHIVSDAWSVNVLIQEFAHLYHHLKHHTPANLQPLQCQYKDFAYWQNTLLEQNMLNHQKEYWHKKLGGELTVLDLYYDYPRPSLQSFRGDSVTLNLDPELTARLKSFSRKEVTTLFMVLTTAFKTLLFRWSSQEDILIGTLIAGRSNYLWEKVLGYFINILVLRDTLHGEMKVEELLKNVKKTMLDAYDNQDYPFDKLVDEFKVERNPGRSPVFDVMIVFQNYQDLVLSSAVESLNYEMVSKDYVISKYDLYLDIFEMSDQIRIVFEFCMDLFTKATIERMAGHYLNILKYMLAYPKQLISKVDMMSQEEKQRILHEFNATDVGYPTHKRVEDFFLDHVAATPDHLALVEAGTENIPVTNLPSHTYRQLHGRARKLAAMLVQRGVQPGTVVGVMVERSLEMMVGIFGIVIAGAAYLPIDPGLPKERREFMLKDSDAKLLLTRKSSGDIHVNGCDTFDLMELDTMDTGLDTFNVPKSADDLIYVIYTSGSTGKPKGVMIAHFSVVNRLLWMQKCYPLNSHSRILQKTPIVFDVSVWELFWWAMQGASLCLLGPGDEKKPEAIVRAIQNHHITTMHFIPSMLTVFLDYIRDDFDIKRLAGLSHVFASGEALVVQQVQVFNQVLNRTIGARLINLYGPTEATVDVSYFDCSNHENVDSVPIGYPIDNIKLFILDKNLQLQAIGLPGELSISGVGLAIGYLNRPILTMEKFIPHPFIPGQRLYKTGDVAKWLVDGKIEYLGRSDNQVKIRGYRIELEEIESRLLSHRKVKNAAVVVKKDDAKGPYLCAFIVPQKDTLTPESSKVEVDIPDLKEYLAQGLPEYMVPAFFVTLDELPLTPIGKLDRRKMIDMEMEKNVQAETEFVAPRTKTEKQIAEIWAKALKIDSLSIYNNFFELGGHSLLIPKIFKKMEKSFPAKLKIADLYEYLTVHQLARYIDGNEPDSNDDDVIVELSID